jgi:hypothetical protein
MGTERRDSGEYCHRHNFFRRTVQSSRNNAEFERDGDSSKRRGRQSSIVNKSANHARTQAGLPVLRSSCVACVVADRSDEALTRPFPSVVSYRGTARSRAQLTSSLPVAIQLIISNRSACRLETLLTPAPSRRVSVLIDTNADSTFTPAHPPQLAIPRTDPAPFRTVRPTLAVRGSERGAAPRTYRFHRRSCPERGPQAPQGCQNCWRRKKRLPGRPGEPLRVR